MKTDQLGIDPRSFVNPYFDPQAEPIRPKNFESSRRAIPEDRIDDRPPLTTLILHFWFVSLE